MSWLVANSLVACLLALLVMAVGRFLRPAPAAMHVLWLFVLLKLATPPLFEVPVDVSWLRGERVVEPAVVPLDLGAAPADVVLPAVPAGVLTTPPASVVALGEVLPWVWGLGSVLFVGFCLCGVASGLRRLRALGPVPPWLRSEVEAVAARLGVRVPELLDDPAAASPCAWSLGRVRLVLPASVLGASPPKGRAAVLAHELAHLRRGDHRFACLELLLASAFWWHPLFWFARARMRFWAELACDAWAVASVPEATIDYATVLVEAVARPDSAVPGMTVLAARPAARAAFERRLTMILNENVPCRSSRAWWLPFTTLGLCVLAVPVAAQEEKAPVRIEVRVNGKNLEELSGEERRALLQRLLREQLEEEEGEARPGKSKKKSDAKQDPAPKQDPPRKKGSAKSGHDLRVMTLGDHDYVDLEALPARLRAGLLKGLDEARVEIRRDKDLRELGITDEVLDLLDSVEEGKGLDVNIDSLVKGALKGAGKVVVKELKADPELRDLGLGEDIDVWVGDLIEGNFDQEMLGDFVRRAIKASTQDAKRKIRTDVDLKKLGITEDVEDLIDGLMKGDGKFDRSLQTIIDKSIKSALRSAEFEEIEAGEEHEEELPAPKKLEKKKAKSSRAGIR
ncbi:MAG TPA: M56 family metallopeptidase [Planctomycetota bacterium]